MKLLSKMVLLAVCALTAFGRLGAAEPNPSAVFIQRTMKALTESTAEKPAHVRVLFYGQSIVAQAWTGMVQDYLKTTYPTVQFEFSNRAIGGYTSPALIRTAESDLYPYYPDLLFFHVYGPIDKYEEIVRRVRERTSAEVILWTSHLSAEQDPRAMLDERDQRSKDILAVAERQKCMVIDLNQKWCRLLLENGWKAQELLGDTIHLKPEGCRYYADFIIEELVRIPDTDGVPEASGTIREIALDDACVAKNADGSLTLAFDGNRVTAISDGSAPEGTKAEILLDGQKMSENADLWGTTRPSTGPMWMPAINLVTHETTPVAEDWTLSALEGSAADGSKILFKVEGSVTGPDGEGVSTERFVSPSGRVVIEPSDIPLAWQFGYTKKTLLPDFKVTWKNYPLFTDPYQASAAGTRTVLVQNCANGPHTLTIRPESGSVGIAGFVVNTPH